MSALGAVLPEEAGRLQTFANHAAHVRSRRRSPSQGRSPDVIPRNQDYPYRGSASHSSVGDGPRGQLAEPLGLIRQLRRDVWPDALGHRDVGRAIVGVQDHRRSFGQREPPRDDNRVGRLVADRIVGGYM